MNLPDIPNYHALAVLLMTAVALYLFSRDDLPLETSSLAVLSLLALGFTVFPFAEGGNQLEAKDLFSGFGHEALVAVCALMIIGEGLVRTGALEPIGRYLAKLWKISPMLSLLITLIVGCTLSAFVNNTPIVVLLLPILISVALRTKTSTTPMLLPMGLATLVGGMTTTIGTSTNLLVVSVAHDMGAKQINMFDFFLPGALAAIVAILYLWLIAPKLLPLPDTVVRDGDRLAVRDYPERLKEYEKLLGATLFSGTHKVDEDHPLNAEKQTLAEVVIIRGSGLIGRTLQQVNFVGRHAVSTVALHRDGRAMDVQRRSIGRVRLEIGDILLVQGEPEQISQLKQSQGFLVLDGASDLPHTSKAPLTLVILFFVVALAAFGILPIVVSSVIGVLALVFTGCLNWREATSALSSEVILIVAASLALGSAMMKTGAAEYIASIFVIFSSSLPPVGVISALMMLLAILTNIVSNNAAAVIGTPIAISVAQQLNMPPEALILAVLFGANLSYATPMAYSTNLLVMNAGGYRFSDFMRVGIPLILIMWVTLSFLLSWIYL